MKVIVVMCVIKLVVSCEGSGLLMAVVITMVMIIMTMMATTTKITAQ